MTAKVLAFSTAAEGATGVALLVVPSLVGQLLLGSELSAVASLVARCFGIALVSLGIAAWPGGTMAEPPLRAIRAMVVYNGMIAGVLGYAGTTLHLVGPLLWPAVGIHAVVALLLMRPPQAH